ncbi:MAG TPA: hydrogenase expression/formation protein HypE [Victivallales bacterium]|nr:hydrogenase expression/formation protein HypE [Victivallales bacterium]
MEDKIQIAHGSGGKLSSQLIDSEIVSRFGEGPLKGLPDAAMLEGFKNNIIFSTDSYVVHPIEFPGGNIGNLAVHGTVNDVSVAGGKPKWLSLGVILEEGLSVKTFQKILDTIKLSAKECGVKIVTGDTKVVAKGQCDGIYINTAGIGEAIEGFNLDKNLIKENDCIIVSGNIGDHGMAVLSAREGINIENGPLSDTGSVHRLVQNIQPYAKNIKFMRDPTRGGIASVLNEIVSNTEIGAILDSQKIPVAPGTNSISEILGIDILSVACEGRMLLICSESVSKDILNEWHKFPEGKNAAVIGKINSDKGRVTLSTVTGGTRLVDVPMGELLPRIC